MQDNNRKVPEVTIDDALNLFLAVTYPDGIPEGVDKEQLLEILRQKIAKDRPEWARADAQASASSAADSEAKNYSRVKEEITRRAQQEDVPQDPEERYFYERRKQAQQNRLQKEEDNRERQIREDLRQRLAAQKKEAAEETLEKAVRIRQALEQRLKKALQVQGENTGPLNMKPPDAGSPQPLQHSQPTTGHIEQPHIGQPQISTFDRNFWENLKTMEPKEQVESLRRFNRDRREKLKTREEVLKTAQKSTREKQREPLILSTDRENDEPRNTLSGIRDKQKMGFSHRKERQNQPLKLEL
jgi:hypothetical protein